MGASVVDVLSPEKRRELMTYDPQNGRAQGSAPAKKSLIEIMSTVEEEEINPIWVNRLARGKLGLLGGESDVGKSTVMSDIAARLSNGKALPFDKEPEAPLRSLIFSPEEGAADTLKPRLKRFGADLDMIAIPRRDLAPSGINANLLDRMLQEFPAALTVLDPVTAFARGRNTSSQSDVRDLLMPFVQVAEKHNTAIVMIAHLNKGDGRAIDRILGSVEFKNVVRSIFLVACDPSNPERRLMTHSKCSFGPKQPTLEFFIDSKTGEFRWGAETSDTVDEALSEPRRERETKQLEAAKQFIHETLANGPMASNDVLHKAEAAGISRATLWRAKKAKTDIKANKVRGTGEWFWRLAEKGEN